MPFFVSWDLPNTAQQRSRDPIQEQFSHVTQMKIRLLVASMYSSLAAVLAIAFVVFIRPAADVPEALRSLAALKDGTFYFLLVGWPLAFLTTLCIGVPLYATIEARRGAVSKRTVLFSATALGSCGFMLVWAALANGFSGALQSFLAGAVGGCVAGACFWFIASRWDQWR